ncbi:hypothetical protein [Streptomyces sp. NPDC016845]|uniref:hypothetical protein n=1 Tax=Streptomyces sp. NPDC016845 TaxID=3364972 RepID=UPI00378775B8
MPHRLCRALCDSLNVAGASMSLLTHTEARQVLCASGADALRVEELQFESGQGPCMQASEYGSPVVCLDPGEYLSQWPVFGSRLREELPHVALLLALPLTPANTRQPIGAIDLVRHTPWCHGEDPLPAASAAARAVAGILLRRSLQHVGGAQPLPWEPAEMIDAHWGRAQRAAGRLAARRDIDITDALALLRARAFATGRPLPQVCTDLLDELEG